MKHKILAAVILFLLLSSSCAGVCRVEVPPKVVKVAKSIGEAAARVAIDVVGAALKNKAEELLATWLD